MTPPTTRRRPPALDQGGLEELALRYAGRYATTRAKLLAYLVRKVRERGWGGSAEPDLEGLASRFSELGYVDDRAYALAKARALTSRGYGTRFLDERLRLAGVSKDEREQARDLAEEEAVHSALRFASRRSIGPFAAAAADPRQKEKQIAAMVRAGHSFALARAIAALRPGAQVDEDELRRQSSRTYI